jgi:hypothetical protein
MKYVSTIYLEEGMIGSITYQAKSTETESVAAAIAMYAHDGHTAENLMSIKTRAYEST